MSRTVTITCSVLLLLCMAGSVVTLRAVDAARPEATLEEVLYLPSPNVIKRLSLGYTGLLADIYWTRAVQYFGSKHYVRSKRYDLLYPLLDITTTLDPQLIIAYEFGSIFLSQEPPHGAGQPDLGVKLVQKGIDANPAYWRLYYSLGYIHYLERHDYEAAHDAFQKGSEIPGALPWMKVMSALMAQHGGDIGTARFLWTRIYEGSTDPQIRLNALKRLAALRVDEEVPQIEQLVQIYARRHGQLPSSWDDMIHDGLIRRTPTDPVDHPYILMDDGTVQVQDPESLPFITKGLPPGVEAPKFIKDASKS